MQKQLINLDPVKEQVKQKLIEKYDTTTFMNTDTVSLQVSIKEILEQYIEDKHLVEPTVYITMEAHTKMRMLVDETTTEIGWYGIVTKSPGLENTYVIEDIIVYPQRVTGATCEQDDDKMFEFEMSLTTEQVNHKRFQGHSHVNMGVTPSGVDEQFYQDLLKQVNDYFIITVTNKSGAYHTRFYDMENNILYKDVPITVITDAGTPLKDWYEESKDKLSQRSYTTIPSTPTDKPTAGASAPSYSSLWDKDKYHSPYDDYDDFYDQYDNGMVWDNRLGYITKEEKRWLDSRETTKHQGKKGRPKKGHK